MSDGTAPSFSTRRIFPLSEPAIAGLAHRQPELPVRAESEPAAIVERRGPDAAADDEAVEGERAVRGAIAEDLIPPLALVDARRAHVDEARRGEVGVDGDAHEA